MMVLRVAKKKVTISVADNIIPDPDVSLKLGKSIIFTVATEEEAVRQVHAIHARIMTEFVPELPRRRSSEQEAAVTIQALKESKKTSEDNQVLEAQMKELIYSDEDDQKKDNADDDKSIDLEMTNDEETDDEFVHGDKQVNFDEDEEMINAKVENSGKGDAEISDVAKVDAEKIEEIKDDAKKVKLPPTSSILSVSSGFSDQVLKLSSDTSLVSTFKDIIDAQINLLLDIKIQYEVPHIQSLSVLTLPVLVIFEPYVLTHIPETPLVAPVSTLLTPSFISTIPLVPYQTTVPIPASPITIDAPTITTFVPESDAVSTVQRRRYTADLIQKYSVKPAPEYSKIQKPTIDLEQESEKSASDIRKIKREQAEKQKMLKYTIKSTDKAALKEYD
ncbi:hypothetical protein Tco_0518980 [Tanacetum coccineum]